MTIDPQRLAHLAQDRSAFARGRLLLLLSREVLVERRLEGGELAIFYDIARVVLPAVGIADRRIFCETVVDQSHLPRDLMLGLANDDITVAEPMLAGGRALTDPDLVDIVTRRDDGHRFAIAGRTVVSGLVSEALVRTGSRRVLHRLGNNRGADFTDVALRTLQHRAEDDQELFKILIEREDLTRLLGRTMRATLERIAEIPAPQVAGFGEPEAPQHPPIHTENAGVADMVARIRAGRLSLAEAVGNLAEGDRHADLACLLGLVADVDESQILRVLVRSDANGIATVMRGLALGPDTWAKVVDLRRRRLKFSATQARIEREHWDRVDPDQARATLEVHGGRRARA